MALAPLRGSGAHEVWSSDGQHLASSVPAVGISIARADGASPPQPLVRERTLLPSSFSPDGRRLAYSQGGQLWTVSLERQGDLWKAGTPERFMENTFRETSAAFSPDGRWLAYQSNESGKDEVYVRPSSHSPSRRGGKWQISNSGGTAPRWSRTGDIVYQSGDQILAARYKADGDAFVADKPRVWIANFSGTRREGGTGLAPATWDLSPDGTRILGLIPADDRVAPTPDRSFVFLQNFFDELRLRAPLPR